MTSPVTFLSPESGLLAGALALPTLIALYLLKLRRRPLRVSSTLLWTQAMQDLEVNVPLRWLKASLLLILHLLIVLLLCLAIARPTLSDSAGHARRTIFLIDRSASMSAADMPDGTTRLDDAKSKAAAAIDALSRQGRAAAIVTFAAQPVIQSGFSSSASALTAAVRDITPTDQPADLAAALKLADSLITGQGEGSEESTDTTDLVLLSDGNIPDPPHALSTTAQLRFINIAPPLKPLPEGGVGVGSVSKPLPEGGVGVGSLSSSPNLAITALSARRDDTDPATIRIFVRLQSTATAARTVSLTLSLNAEVIQRKPIEIPGLAPTGAPGETTTTFELNQPQGGVLLVSLPPGDALASDDSAALILPPARKPAVLLVQPPAVARTDDPTGDLSPDWLLSDALKEMPLASLRKVTADQALALAAAPGAIDLIVYDRVRPDRLPAVPTLSFGVPLELPGTKWTNPPADAASASIAYPILSWERPHPALRDVALDTLIFAHPLTVTIDPQAADAAKLQITELARSPRGPALVLFEQPTPAGTIRRIAATFELQQSNWPLSTGFPIFLSNAIDFLTLRAEQSAGKSFTTAEPAFTSPASRQGVITLRGPITLTADIPPGAAPDAKISLGLVERAGIYLSTPDARAADNRAATAVAINMSDPFESSLRTRSSFPIAGREVKAGVIQPGAREIWTWLLMVAAALMTIEWFVHAAKARV